MDDVHWKSLELQEFSDIDDWWSAQILTLPKPGVDSVTMHLVAYVALLGM